MITTAPERLAIAAIAAAAAQDATGFTYVDFYSAYLEVDVRCGMEFEGEEFQYQHCTIAAGWEIRDVWIGGADLSQYLRDDVMPYLEAEAIKAMEAASPAFFTEQRGATPCAA